MIFEQNVMIENPQKLYCTHSIFQCVVSCVFSSSSFNFLWTHCLYLFRYRKFYRALCSVASVCADGFSLAHKCECMLVCAMCICVSVLHLKPAFISFSIKDIGIHTDLIIMWALNIFHSRFLLFTLTCSLLGSQERPSALYFPTLFFILGSFFVQYTFYRSFSLSQYVSVSDIKEWRTPSFFYCCSRVVCMLHHHGVLIFFLLSIFISFYTCKWTLCDGSFSLM